MGSNRTEQAAAADQAGRTAFPGTTSSRPARLLSYIVRCGGVDLCFAGAALDVISQSSFVIVVSSDGGGLVVACR